MTTTDTPHAQSADTPESVAARGPRTLPSLTRFLGRLWRGAERMGLHVEDDFRGLYDAALDGTITPRHLAQLACDEVRHSTDDPVDGISLLMTSLFDDLDAQAAEIARLEPYWTAVYNLAGRMESGSLVAEVGQDPWRLTEELDTTERARLNAYRERDEAVERAAHAEAALADERAQVQAMREALEDIQCIASAAIGPNCGAGPDLIRIAGRAEAALSTPTAEQPTPAEAAGIRGEPCLRVDVPGDVVRSIRVEPGMTDDEVNVAAAVADRPGDGYDLARELAEVVDETWIFLAVWSQTYAIEHGQPMAPVHAKMLARVHAVMTRAHAAGLVPTLTTTRLPVILAEHGYDAAGLLPEGKGRDNG